MEYKFMEKLFIGEYGEAAGNIHTFFSPGRVNLIGEHIDYNGGLVFPCALTIGIFGSVRYRNDNIIRLRSKNIKGEVVINIDENLDYKAEDGWGNYPKGVIKELLLRGHNIKGMDILIYSNLPDGSGLSSSAALEVLIAYIMLYTEKGEPIDRVELSKMCQKVENKFIGVNCGIMDQFSVALGKKNNAIVLDCNTLFYEYAPMNLHQYLLVIMNTNKKRELAESKYNERRQQCEEALDCINKNKSEKINNLCQASLEDIQKYIHDEVIKKRAVHVVTENQRVKSSVDKLKSGDIEGFGQLMIKSHESLRKDYEVTGINLDTIVEEALKAEGCIGARMTGAGFGGCAIALVTKEKIDYFKETVSSGYEKVTRIKPEFYTSDIGDGVSLISKE